MKALKSARTLAASLGVLAVGALAATPAQAFNEVDWEWEKDIKEKVDIDVYIDVDIESTGLVEVEKLQIFLGNSTATSYVFGIFNLPPEQQKPRWEPEYDLRTGVCKKDCTPPSHGPKGLNATTELPIVLSSASAFGNLQTITSDVPVLLHDGQFVANLKDKDRCDKWCNPTDMTGLLPSGETWKSRPGHNDDKDVGNLHTQLAGAFLYLALTKHLEPADIKATSVVGGILNASVDSSATAAANFISVDLASDVDGGTKCDATCGGDRLSNHVVIADITQFAYANVEATSTVFGVVANGYTNMRDLKTETLSPTEGYLGNTIDVPTPWISSVATSIGNGVTINVGRDLTTPAPKH